MLNQRRLLQLFSLIVSTGFADNILAQEAVSSGNWSDSSIWAGGTIPEAGGMVTITSSIIAAEEL